MLRIRWPEGKKFAFTAFDDTDLTETDNVSEVYAFLHDLGIHTTKSVWPLKGERTPTIGGATCEDPEYRAWILKLQSQGFEIGFHNTSYHGMPRSEIERGMDEFKRIFGHDPLTMANHADSSEAIYWGDARVTGLQRAIYNFLSRNRQKDAFKGHVEGSEHFWGDLCQKRVKYVRNFITGEINTLKAYPMMPYHDPSKPYVRYWYAASEGPKIHSFNTTLSEANQDRLEAEGGACIMYTHFACGFQDGKRLDPRFKALMERLAKKGGWFVPVGSLLDYIQLQRGPVTLSPAMRGRLERRWLMHKIRVGGTS